MSDLKHITKSEFYAFQHDVMNQEEKERFLEHISSCNYCSDQFVAMMSYEIISAPRDMKTNILKATMKPEVQIAVKVKETTKRMQLFLYSLKVGTATLGALILLALTMNFTDLSMPSDKQANAFAETPVDQDNKASLTTAIRDNMNTLSNSMMDFSNNIMKTEVTDNDQEEK